MSSSGSSSARLATGSGRVSDRSPSPRPPCFGPVSLSLPLSSAVHGSVCKSDLVPHPLLSDLTLPVTPAPPGQTVLSQATIVDALDRPIPISSHPAFLQQISTWPATDSVEVDFVWGRGALGGAIGPVGLEAGRVAVQIGKRGSGRAVTIRDFVEGVCD